MIHVMATATYSYTVGPSQMPSMLFVEPRCIRLVLQVRSEMTGLIRKLAHWHWHWHWPPKKGFAHTPPLCRFDCLDDTQEAERLEVSWQRLVGVEGEMPGWRPIEHKMGKITKV